MADEQRIHTIVGHVLGEKEILSMERLGGLTNRTYLVKLNSGDYTVRLPG